MDATLHALDRCAEAGYETWQFYDEEDLAARLRSEAFEKVRRKYPDPEP